MEAGALAATPKKAAEEERTIVFVDEAGFCLLPMAVRTYAPCGHTPVLRVKLTHDHLIFDRSDHARGTARDAEPRSCPTRAHDVVRFLRLLLRKLPGKLLVIWDGASIHRAQAIKAFLSRGAAKRIHLERLPGYAPELNPPSGGLESAQTPRTGSNVCCRDLPHVETSLRLAKERLRHRRTVLRQCFTHAGCPV